MWKSVVTTIGLCTLLSGCGGSGGGSDDGGDNGVEPPIDQSNDLAGTAVAVFDAVNTTGDLLYLEEVDTVYTSAVDGSTHSNGSTFYLAPELSQISDKNDNNFVPAYFVADDEICLSISTPYSEVQIDVSYDATVTSDVTLRPCAIGEVDFTQFPDADIVSIDLNDALSPDVVSSDILQEHRDQYNVASEYLAVFDIDSTSGNLRVFPFPFSAGTYIPAFLDKESGHICVPDVAVGGYMVGYYTDDDAAADLIGDRLTLGLFAATQHLNFEAMLYWGATCE